MQAAAGKRDLLNAGGGAGENCGAHEGKSDCGMKTGCDARLGDAAAQILQSSLHNGAAEILTGSYADQFPVCISSE